MCSSDLVFGIGTYPMNWPIGSGRGFRGVFDRAARRVLAFEGDGHANATKRVDEVEAELGDPALDELIGEENHRNLGDDIELLDGADNEFDLGAVHTGKLTPVFFGSALTNFGVGPFLRDFLRLAPAPLAYMDRLTGEKVDPSRNDFSGFVFKIQANMDKNHRDRIAFVRICSGKFEHGMDAQHVQGKRRIKLACGTAMMADDRTTVDGFTTATQYSGAPLPDPIRTSAGFFVTDLCGKIFIYTLPPLLVYLVIAILAASI